MRRRSDDHVHAAGRRLRDTARELAALEQRKAEFLRFASHEMRGPINVISAYSSMLAEGSFGELTEAVRESTVIVTQKILFLQRRLRSFMIHPNTKAVNTTKPNHLLTESGDQRWITTAQ